MKRALSPKPARAPEQMAGLQKGLAAIEAFGTSRGALTLTEVADFIGSSRPAARRCLLTLLNLGYAAEDGRYFRLAPRVLRLGQAYVSSSPLPRTVQPIIEAACERTRESISVAVLDDSEVIVIARALVRRSLSAGLGVGSRLPAYCSANGRVLLSTLSDKDLEALLVRMPRPRLTPKTITEPNRILREIRLVRTRGYAINDQEVETGLRTIAIALRDKSGAEIASISQSVADSTSPLDEIVAQRLPELQAIRNQVAGML